MIDLLVGSGTAGSSFLGDPGTGTASSDSPPRGDDGDGTAGLDRSELLAFATATEPSYGCAEAVLDGHDDVTSLLVGSVRVRRSIDTPVATAEYELATERGAYFHPASVTYGERNVAIAIRCGRITETVSVPVFLGRQFDAPDDEPFLPHVQAKAQSFSAWALDQNVCYDLPAFAGMRRGDVLVAIGAGLGLTVVCHDRGQRITKRVNFRGKFSELVDQYAEIEAWIPRELEDGSGIELVKAFSGPVRLAFGPDDGFSTVQLGGSGAHGSSSIGEQPPQRPAIRHVVTYTTPVPPTATTYSTTGNPTVAGDVVEVTKFGDAEVLRRVTTRAVFSTPGVTPGPEILQVQRVVETRQNWALTYITLRDGSTAIAPSRQLLYRQTLTFEVAGIKTEASAGYQWDGGPDHYTFASAFLMLTKSVIELFTWGSDCLLRSQVATTYENYSPLDGVGIGAHDYGDGTRRQDPSYAFTMVGRVTITWGSNRVPPIFTTADTFRERWRTSMIAPDTGLPIEAFQFDPAERDTWQDDGIGGWVHTKPDGTTENGTGGVPLPPIGGIDSVQYAEVTTPSTRSVVGPWSPLTQAETNPHVETEEDVSRLCAWRFIRDFGVRLLRPSTIVPHLRPGDVVTIVDPSRGLLDPTTALIESDEITVGVLNFDHDQAPVLLIPPAGVSL